MIRTTDKNMSIMGLMVNARTNEKWFTRSSIIKAQKKNKRIKVHGNYLDVLLKRMFDDGLIERQKVMGERGRRVWGYRATEFGKNWFSDPSLRNTYPASTQNKIYSFVPLEETIERDGWVERWNEQVLLIPEWAALLMRKHMKQSRNFHKDAAKQTIHDSPAFKAIISYGKRSGYTLRMKFNLEPWRDHFAEWLGYCGFELDAIMVFIGQIEDQLPGSFKQQEHRVTGKFGGSARRVEARMKITSIDLETGRKLLQTELEYSRIGEMQMGGDAQIVDGVAGSLAAYQHEAVLQVSQERGRNKKIQEAILLLAEGKNEEAAKLLGGELKKKRTKKDVSYIG